MSSAATQKNIQSTQRREEREARKRQKELEQLLKEQAKLSLQDRARMEVEAHENLIEVLLSVHRESSRHFDWMALMAALPVHKAMGQDEEAYLQEYAEWESMRSLSRRVLAGDSQAYADALSKLSAFGELSTLGSFISFRVEHAKLIECELHVCGKNVIPAEVKSLSSAGKVITKAMPKGRFHDLYQDYVCGCVLRVAREVFALLPVDVVIVTTQVPVVQASTGQEANIPVLSAAIPREVVDKLDFSRLDPSDSMESFVHRGDVMASRKSGEFTAIVPLAAKDIAAADQSRSSFEKALHQVREMRTILARQLKTTLAEDKSTQPI
ncbi:MAG: hypothetical protein ACYC67_10805 [Prosthecobacter sp.]